MLLGRLNIIVKGTVQGVGFRPTICRLATAMNLSGTVQNLGNSVQIVLEGTKEKLEHFYSNLPQAIPPKSTIDQIQSNWEIPKHIQGFSIIESKVNKQQTEVCVPADLATCLDCLNEFNDPQDNRYLYPFITCINCGPRYTVVNKMPYDRQRTTMNTFPLCRFCKKQYSSPSNRRFHAESIACPQCGPQLSLYTSQWQPIEYSDTQGLRSYIHNRLQNGDILGLRGIGGYQLVCDASNELALKKLRLRKNRPHKPLAVMAPNMDAIKEICYTTPKHEAILSSSQAPILILELKNNCHLPTHLISPDSNNVGIMLPTTPIHHTLFNSTINPINISINPTEQINNTNIIAQNSKERPHQYQTPIPNKFLIMTSGNIHGDPICGSNFEAKQYLSDIADFFATHNREIARVCDDSLIREIKGKPRIIRRARGIAPNKIQLPFKLKKNVLALGGELKNTICLAYDDHAVMSPHIGDLSYYRTFELFKNTINNFSQFLGKKAQIIAVDMHPDYQSTLWGQHLSSPIIKVQHHHAHAVSCMIESNLNEALAIVFDGSGYGPDGTIWGGEFLYTTLKDFQRLARIEPSALPGGEAAIKRPVRNTVARLLKAGINIDSDLCQLINICPQEVSMMSSVSSTNVSSTNISSSNILSRNIPYTSSMGRLFDAVATLLGLVEGNVTYEGQAAVRLETLASQSQYHQDGKFRLDMVYPFNISKTQKDPPCEIQLNSIYIQIINDIKNNIKHDFKVFIKKNNSLANIAWQFHNTVCAFTCEFADIARNVTGVSEIVLSGGVFQNKILSELISTELEKRNFKVFLPKLVPCNDGGISIGQAVIAHEVYHA